MSCEDNHLVVLPHGPDAAAPQLAVARQHVEEHSPAQGAEVVGEVAVQREGEDGGGAVLAAEQLPEGLRVQQLLAHDVHGGLRRGGPQSGAAHQHEAVHAVHLALALVLAVIVSCVVFGTVEVEASVGSAVGGVVVRKIILIKNNSFTRRAASHRQ